MSLDSLLRTVHRATFGALLAISPLYACGGDEKPSQTSQYCLTDQECKGDRICGEDGKCHSVENDGNIYSVAGNWCGAEVASPENCRVNIGNSGFLSIFQSGSAITGRHCVDGFNIECDDIRGSISGNSLTYSIDSYNVGFCRGADGSFWVVPEESDNPNRYSPVTGFFTVSDDGKILSGEYKTPGHEMGCPLTFHKI
ncbi:hypothetical protein J4420_01115 [Candidatus Woesearchaeota archaeon]|nr:hypothetical protein [Candidatus Woesearchaeota archaeon]